MHRGRWPANLPRLQPGSYEWAEARELARHSAHAILDPSERACALTRVRADYGDAPTSRTLQQIKGTDV